MDKTKVLYFDTETTGFSPATEDLLQLSIIDGNGDVLYDSYFHPVMNATWDEAERINHISPAMVEDAPLFAEELSKIQAIFDSAEVICGYNINFDLNFLTYNGITIGEGIGRIDVLEMARKYVHTERHKLSVVAEYLGYDFQKCAAHNSLGDALATKYVHEKMMDSPIK